MALVVGNVPKQLDNMHGVKRRNAAFPDSTVGTTVLAWNFLY